MRERRFRKSPPDTLELTLPGKLLKKYDLNRPLFMWTNLLHGEEEIADLIRKYNLHEL
jgi:hypothetical protein